jgi:hypothetical protein
LWQEHTESLGAASIEPVWHDRFGREATIGGLVRLRCMRCRETSSAVAGFLVALCVVAMPAVADQPTSQTFRGDTNQGYQVEMDTKNDRPSSVFFSKYKVPCEGENPYVEPELYYSRFDQATRTRLDDHGGYRNKARFGRVAYRLSADRVEGGWDGQLRVRTKTLGTEARCRAKIAFSVRSGG